MDKKDSKNKSPKADIGQIKHLWKYIRPYRNVYLIGWLFLICSSLMAMIFPGLMGQLLGANSKSSSLIEIEALDLTNIDLLLIALVFVFALQAFFSFFRIVTFNHVTERVLRDIKHNAFNKLIHLPLDYFNKNKVGELTSRIATDINLLQETLNTTVAEFFRQFLTIFIGVTLIFLLSWKLALWMLAVVPMLAIIAIIFGRYIRKISKKAQDESAKSISILEEVLTGIVNVKSFTNEDYESSRFLSKINNVLLNNISSGIARALFVSFIILCLFGGIAFIIWKAKTMEFNGEISSAAFNAFILYTIFIGASFGSLPELYGKLQKALGSTEHLFGILKEEEEFYEGKSIIKNVQGKLTFCDVHFAYAQRKEIAVLKGINFECKEGEITAVVGSSGSGKTTLANLIMRLYTPDSGEIKIDEEPVQQYNLSNYRQNIAYVPQEVLLFGGTIEENIRYGNPNATFEEIKDAAEKANAFQFIDSFPDKFKTIVGDRGIQLSGGQRQRIAIARAILKNPKILILDEATSALDVESEKLVQHALNKLMVGRTSFVIAHRLSTIKNANQIIVLENGTIVEKGNHEDLVNLNGVYAKLQNLQVNQKEELS